MRRVDDARHPAMIADTAMLEDSQAHFVIELES